MAGSGGSQAEYFGQYLRRLRIERGISQAELSRLVHYTKSYLSKVENGAKPPTPDLAQICDEVLDADGALIRMGHRPRRRDHSHGSVPPWLLPVRTAGFVGRSYHLGLLDAVLACRHAQDAATILLVTGPPGVGKTTLVIEWAHRVADSFQDGALFADLRGYAGDGLAVHPSEVLGTWLQAIGVHHDGLPATFEAQCAMFRTLMFGRQALLIVDNAADVNQVRPLLAGSPGCVVLVTSRDRLSGLVVREGAMHMALKEMSPLESATLLLKIMGSARSAAELRAVAELTRLCGGLPLALRLAGNRAAAARCTPREVVAELTAAADRLDVLACEDESSSMRAAFCSSYRALQPEVARMFRLLGLHPGPEFSVAAAAALADVSPATAACRLDRLAAINMIEETGQDRFKLHELLQVYASERVRAEEPSRCTGTATRRVLGWYLGMADAADRVLFPRQRRRPTWPCEGSRRSRFADYDDALAWLEAERPNLVAATKRAAEAGEHAIAWRMPIALSGYFMLRKKWPDCIATCEVGLRSARHLKEEFGEAWILSTLGIAYADERRIDDATGCFEQALVIRPGG